MRFIRLTPGWAIATVGLLLALLITTTIVALLGTSKQKSAAESLETASLYAGALADARADFISANASMAAVGLNAAVAASESKSDVDYLLSYSQALGRTHENLAQARTIALSQGRDTDVALVDGFIARVGSYDQGIQSIVATYLTEGVEKAVQAQDEVAASALELVDDLKAAVDREQALVSAQRASAVETSDRSFRVQLILGAFALVAATAAGGTIVVGTRRLVHNIEQRKQAEGRIKYLAYHDPLTDLPNRALLEDRLATALAQARGKNRMLALLSLDLDRFKRINDTIGRPLGDRVLQGIAERLTGIVREADTVARVGCDEFTILLSEVSRVQDAVDVADAVLEALKEPLTIEGREVHTSISMGVAIYPSDGEEVDTLLRNAAIAMYRTKERGGDSYQLYAPTMDGAVADPLALESELRRALERDEFVLYYQPQVSIADWQIVGVEALIRWRHPDRGLVLPLSFIPMAEETGLIVSLGEWVLHTACAQAKAWQEAGLPPVRMAVNISGRQFQLQSLVEVVGQVLRETALDPRCLQLEITESVAVQDVDFTSKMLGELREMGIQVAIDDFGSGHSSLNYLKRLPIDHVKIDHYFVRDVAADPNDAAIVRSIVAMAHDLNLKVVAEGVETEQQLAFLREWRCDIAQGFLFSEPLPAGAVQQIIERGARVPAIVSRRRPA
jgi:diguanylate cyclase (GGDEF)-like protein